MLLDINLIRSLARKEVSESLIEQYLLEPASLVTLLEAHAEKLGVTVAAIMREARMSQNQVVLWRRGVTSPNSATLARLSQALNSPNLRQHARGA